MAKNKHICDKMDIIWDKNPIPSDNCIEWQGTCQECKKRVFEVYEQTQELYEVKSGDEIN